MKTICFDLRALQIGHENRGIGMYIKSVLENLEDEENKYFFYCFDKNDPIKHLGIRVKVNYSLVQAPVIRTVLDSPKNILGIFRLVGHRFKRLRRFNPDIFVQFDFMLGMPRWRKTKRIIIGYDLIPLIMKNEYMPSIGFAWYHSTGKRAKLKAILRSVYYQFRYWLHYRSYKKADKIICISKDSEKSFRDLLKIDAQHVTSIPLAPVFSEQRPTYSSAEKIEKPYIFYIGGTDSRKKIQDIVFAFNIVRSRGLDICLVLAGNEFREVNQIPDILGRNAVLRSPYKKDIRLVGFVSDSEKMGLYRSALAFVFTSTYEGFGLPVIESMAQSCPVIAYNNSSIPEAGGDAVIMVETGDYVEIANQIASLGNLERRKLLIAQGLIQANKFSWDKYTAAFLHKLLI